MIHAFELDMPPRFSPYVVQGRHTCVFAILDTFIETSPNVYAHAHINVTTFTQFAIRYGACLHDRAAIGYATTYTELSDNFFMFSISACL